MISKMKKLLLGGRQADKEQVIEKLREAGVVHVVAAEPENMTSSAKLNDDLKRCEKALNELSQVVCLTDEDKIETPGTPNRLVDETLEHTEALVKLRDDKSILLKELDKAQAWGNLGTKDLDYLRSKGLVIKFIQGPADKVNEVDADLCLPVKVKGINGAVRIFMAVAQKEISLPENFTEADAPLRDANLIEEDIRDCEKSMTERNHALQCLKLRVSSIEEYHTKLLNQKRFDEVSSGAAQEGSIFILSGWCPEKQTANLQKIFEESGVKVGISFEDPEENEVPPTLLDNPAYSATVQPLYDFMGMIPSYNEPDTSFLFLSTMIIFSAFLVADAGYGLLVALPLLIFYKKLTSKGVDPKFIRLAIFIFGGAAVYGILTNSWFGYDFKDYPIKFDPGSESGRQLLQQLCFFLGAIHLTIAHVWKIMRKKIDLSIIGEIGWIIFVWAMYALICPMVSGADFILSGSVLCGKYTLTAWLFIVSLSSILLFTAPQKNIFKMISAGVGAILSNASAVFSDILSYIRLWAVGLAGSKVAVAFNQIGGDLYATGFWWAPIGVVVLLICGHSLNIILAIISILAHGVRLNLLEFSNHLELEWAGREYTPFKKID